jgi:hypothetical protein
MYRGKLLLLFAGLLLALCCLPSQAPRRVTGFLALRTLPAAPVNDPTASVKSKAYHDSSDSLSNLLKALTSVAVLDEPVADGQSVCGKPAPDNLALLASSSRIHTLCRLLI